MSIKEALRKATKEQMDQIQYLTNHDNPVAKAIVEEWLSNKAPSIFEEAESLIYGDREQTHGDPSKNLSRIAELWKQFLNRRLRDSIENAVQLRTGMLMTAKELRSLTGHHAVQLNISITDVCHMMQLLKWSRDENHPLRDNIVDDMGYAGLIQRCRETAPQRSYNIVHDKVSVSAVGDLAAGMVKERKPPKRAAIKKSYSKHQTGLNSRKRKLRK